MASHSLTSSPQTLRTSSNKYHSVIIAAKERFNYASLIAPSSSNPRKLWNSINTLLECKPSPLLPSLASSQSLSQMFTTFFSDKIFKLHITLKSSSTVIFRLKTLLPYAALPLRSLKMKCLKSYLSSNSFSDLDPIPTSLLKQCLSALLPALTNVINRSLASGTFLDQFKSCSVIPLLKKYNLDEKDLSNYRPIAHRSFSSKLTERVVKNRLTSHLSTNNILNSYQSAYTKHHSTESTHSLSDP